MTRLSAEALTVKRDGRAIVDNVSASLASGMFVALLGPNGAGKSTLLHCLSGLLKPDEGRVTLDGADMRTFGFKALARRRAFLPQSPRAEWPVSVERLVALGLTPQLPAFGGLPVAMAARVTGMLAQMDLLGHRDQPATTLSGGELARAMLARALVGDPGIVLADEPLAGLDPAPRHRQHRAPARACRRRQAGGRVGPGPDAGRALRNPCRDDVRRAAHGLWRDGEDPDCCAPLPRLRGGGLCQRRRHADGGR